jgi:hypothetical protein
MVGVGLHPPHCICALVIRDDRAQHGKYPIRIRSQRKQMLLYRLNIAIESLSQGLFARHL